MHVTNHSRIYLADELATKAFAAQFAPVLLPGLMLYLRGDLGAGKTTLVRSLLQALGYIGRVKSPTYTLLERYEAGGLSLLHFDLYRFHDAEEWENSGFRDEFDGRNVCLVEWPEKAQGLLPPADIVISIKILESAREIEIEALTHAGQLCLNALPA